MKKIQLQVNEFCLQAVLYDTPAGQAIWDSLPISAKGNLWGDEIYFSIDARVKMENGREVVEEGDLGFWPPGSAFCIFYGLTPVSSPGEIRPASPVEVVGKIIGDYKVLKQVKSTPKVTITPSE
ncbi:cyclophilin-like fold protein [Effusibacillus consociatus]|uniref:Cyclophilin-like fold protein n=1 Tax=Effusibacillus consociatus TaxID=1117041 RepID=A0ABV9PW27_9BACL